MMETKPHEYLQSTGYRCLFECAKQEGIESLWGLVQDIKKLPSPEILLVPTIMENAKTLAKLSKKNKKVIRYLKEHAEELRKFSLYRPGVVGILESLYQDSALLDTYLKNAKRLEALGVSKVDVVSSLDSYYNKCCFYKGRYFEEKMALFGLIFRRFSERNAIIDIEKYYTDGTINAGTICTENLAVSPYDDYYRYYEIPFSVGDATFVLGVHSSGYHLGPCFQSEIKILDFGFDGSKLPTEEEIQKYEIPKQFIKN